MTEVDFAVIGGGSAGYAAARTAASLGLSTMVVDGADPLGGLCILRGCMPSKTLIESANRFRAMREAAQFGLRARNLSVVPEEIVARKRRLIGEFADYRQQQLADGRFELVRGTASFTGSHELTITLHDGSAVERRFRAALIATGSVIQRLEIDGLETAGYLTSDEVLDQSALPQSVIMLGGGAIALEMAHYYEGLGVRVTIVQRSDQVLKSSDTDVARVVETASRARGIALYTGTQLLAAGKTAHGKWVRFRHGSDECTVEAEEIILATGRVPRTDSLGLEKIGIKRDRRGAVEVDAGQASSVNHVFAAGDVASPVEVVHIAIQQGEVAAHNAAKWLGRIDGPYKEMDYRLKLLGIFTEPEVAQVGLTEREAEALGIAFFSASYPFNDHGKSMIAGVEHGFVKLIADRSGKLIGGAVVGPHAVELIHEITVAMAFHATAAQLAQVPHYHPTLSEIWTYPAEDLEERVRSFAENGQS